MVFSACSRSSTGLIATLLTALAAVLAGGLLAHRGLGERKPWLVLGLAPHLGAGLLSLLALVTLHKPLLLYSLMLLALLLAFCPGPGWEKPRGQLTATSLALLALTPVLALGGLDDSGFRPVETARFLRGWQGWPGPGLDGVVAALSQPATDPLAAAWGVRLALLAGGSLLLAGLIPSKWPPALGLGPGLLWPWVAPVGAPVIVYGLARRRVRALPLLLLVPLYSSLWPPAAVPGAPQWQTPREWRARHQQLRPEDLQALAWLGLQALPGERWLSDRPGCDRAVGELCGLAAAPRDAVWQAFRETGRADLLTAAGVSWLWVDVSRHPLRHPLLSPGPRYGTHQIFGVLAAGEGYLSDYRFPCRVNLPQGLLRAGRWYPLALDVTNHDRFSRRLGWVRVQVRGEPPLDILAGRGRLAPEMGDRLAHSLVTPSAPGRYVLEVSQPHTVEGRPWVIARVPLEVAP